MKVAIIGAGNMGGAIATGLISNNYEVTVVDPVNETFGAMGIETHKKIGTFITEAQAVIIAVKPWLATHVARELAAAIGNSHMLICSIAAGYTLDEMSELFTTQPLFRIMPNTAVSVGQGMSFVAAKRATDDELKAVNDMFATLGSSLIIQETQIDACMALASCGIAYALRYARAAMEGGIELGMPATATQAIISQTMKGAAALLDTGRHPEAEIDKVTTPGGITIKGLNAMERNGFTNAVIEGLKSSK